MIPGLIRWFHDREVRATERDQSALIDQIVAEQRRPVLPNVWQEMNGDQLGIPTKAIRTIVGQFHGYALAAPLRGTK